MNPEFADKLDDFIQRAPPDIAAELRAIRDYILFEEPPTLDNRITDRNPDSG